MTERQGEPGAAGSSSDHPSPSPLTTTVNWQRLTGARLEELLFGFLDQMGAQELVWRAGSASGVTASDGGRDLEATFAVPSPDGTVEATRWWVEAKGRTSTVARRDVVEAVTTVSARSDVDVFVFCTNSRFSNPTRDWVTTWQSSHSRPRVRLWDRDDLSRFARRYPLVAARVLPESLGVEDRLDLLIERFEEFGEPPTLKDAEFFWSRPDVLTHLDLWDLLSAVTMFSYSESDHGLVDRPWVTLVPSVEQADVYMAAYATAVFPRMAAREMPRPLDPHRVTQVAAYLLLAAMASIDPSQLHPVLENPLAFLEGLDDVAADARAVEAYSSAVVLPIWSRVQYELLEVCSSDCRRLLGEPGAAFPPPLIGERYWRRFGLGDPPDDRWLQIENLNEPCLVGLPLSRDRPCPLGTDPEISLERVTDLTEILRYRRSNPSPHAYN